MFVSYICGSTKLLSSMLQATATDIIAAYTNIKLLQTQLKTLWCDCDGVFAKDVWKWASKMPTIGDT